MADLIDKQIEFALDRGRARRRDEPRTAAARYDRQHGRIVVELTNGCTFTFPSALAEGLQAGSEDQLAEVEILGAGSGLHWESLDVDLSVPGLLVGLFGTKAFMARHAGQTKSAAKTAAARKNGAKGGRPRKASSG